MLCFLSPFTSSDLDIYSINRRVAKLAEPNATTFHIGELPIWKPSSLPDLTKGTPTTSHYSYPVTPKRYPKEDVTFGCAERKKTRQTQRRMSERKEESLNHDGVPKFGVSLEDLYDSSDVQADPVHYDVDLKIFLTKINFSNVFSDPFETDPKVRTEKWVHDQLDDDSSSPSTSAQEDDEETMKEKKKRLDTIEEVSTVSSEMDKGSLSSAQYRSNLHLATEVQCEIETEEVERFWDYLYSKSVTPQNNSSLSNTKSTQSSEEKESDSPVASDHTVEKNRELEEILLSSNNSPVLGSSSFFQLESLSSGSTSDRGVVEEGDLLSSRKASSNRMVSVATSTADLPDAPPINKTPYRGSEAGRYQTLLSRLERLMATTDSTNIILLMGCDVESSSTDQLLKLHLPPSPNPSTKNVSFDSKPPRRISSPKKERKELRAVSPIQPPILKKADENRESIRIFMQQASERLFKDLQVLITERDRAQTAMEILPSKASSDLSVDSNYYQARYRQKIESNKGYLDKRIDEIWLKLLEMPISEEIARFVGSVENSKQLTLNVRRNLPMRRCNPIMREEKKRNEFELANMYAQRLNHMRAVIRRDSESSMIERKEDSMMDIMNRVSQNLKSAEKQSPLV